MYQNKVTLIGFLGSNPEVRTANNGSFTTLSLATKSSYKKDEKYISHTEWHRCVVFGKLSEFAKTLTKGAHVQVEGELRSREYESKKTDKKQRVWEIRVASILKLDRAEKAAPEDQDHDEVPQEETAEDHAEITTLGKEGRLAPEAIEVDVVIETRVLDRRPSDRPVREMPNATLICNNFLMCGRYRLSRRKQVVVEYFDTAPVEHDWNPRYNIAPTQDVPIVRQNPKEPIREIRLLAGDSFHRGLKTRLLRQR